MRQLLLRLVVLVAFMFIALPVMAMSDTGPPGMDNVMLTGQEVVAMTTCPNNLGYYTRILGTSDPPGVEIMKEALINPNRGVMIAGLIVAMNTMCSNPPTRNDDGLAMRVILDELGVAPVLGSDQLIVSTLNATGHENGATIEMAATARSGTSMQSAANLSAPDDQTGGTHCGKMSSTTQAAPALT